MVQQKKERPNPTTQTTKMVPFQTTNTKKEQNVWELWPDEPRVVVYIQHHTTTEGAVANREEERVHLLSPIFVTAPVFHLDTSWLNADADWNTARREKGATKKRKTKPTTQTTTTRSRFKPQPKKKKNTCETCDPTNLEMSYIFNNTPQRKAPWPTEREREFTYWIP